MRNLVRRTAAILCALVCLAPPAFAAGPQDHADPRSTDAKRTAGTHAGSGTTTVLGSAWTASNLPLALPRVRLRNVDTGQVQASTIGNEGGLFSFENVGTGSYVVELVNEGGKTLAVGHIFTAADGETVATFVRLGTKVPAFAAIFGNTLLAVSATAAAQGITALAPVPRPVSADK